MEDLEYEVRFVSCLPNLMVGEISYMSSFLARG